MASTNTQLLVMLWCAFSTHVTAMAVERSTGGSRVLIADEDLSGPRCYTREDSFCEDVFNYPSYEIRRFLNRNTSFSAFFDRVRPSQGPVKPGRVGSNYPDTDEDEVRVCDVNEKFVRPRAARNRNGNLRYIVNDDHNYQQHIKVETCRRSDEECSQIAGALASGDTSRCVQKYTYFLLVAFDEQEGEPFMDDFKFPTACVCLIRRRFYR